METRRKVTTRRDVQICEDQRGVERPPNRDDPRGCLGVIEFEFIVDSPEQFHAERCLRQACQKPDQVTIDIINDMFK